LLQHDIYAAILVITTAATLIFFYHNTRDFQKSLLYTLVVAKIFTVLGIAFGLDKILFYIVIYRRQGDVVAVLNKIPITSGFVVLTFLATSALSLYALSLRKVIV